jgi:hypothetical protein
MNNLIIDFLRVSNEAITATTVIIAASLLLYNLSHNLRDRVVRASSVVLACVTAAYIGSVFIVLGSGNPFAQTEAWLRFQWIGIAFIPAGMFHLSDTLLETTGVISRGRRKRIVRILYLYGIFFLLTATFTPLVIQGFERNLDTHLIPTMQPGPLFPLYLVYFAAVVAFSINNVLRARRRCLTSVTWRRMSYLLAAFPMPAIGIFPYTLLLPQSQENAILVWLLFNLANVAVALMLAFMGYPLAFFGQSRPDRVIKSELLRFFLRGPMTGIAVLLVILFLPGIRAFGLPGLEYLPFITVATVLLMQWLIALALPRLDRWLVYGRDQQDARQLQELSEHLLTKADARQLFETILAAMCEHLRTPSAFIISFIGDQPRIESSVGSLLPAPAWLRTPELAALHDSDTLPAEAVAHEHFISWQSYWLIPLRSERANQNTNGNGHQQRMIGLMGIWARSPQPELVPEELPVFLALHRRAARVLDDLRLQGEVLGILEGLMPEIEAVQQLSGPARHGSAPALANEGLDVIKQADFADLIRDALRDYWGGPRLSESRLLQLKIVRKALNDNDGNPARAVRAILQQAIESLRPEGQPNLSNEWMLYNLLDLRYVQGKKMLEVADKLSMSEANLYRKLRVAIDQIAQRIADMEREANRT